VEGQETDGGLEGGGVCVACLEWVSDARSRRVWGERRTLGEREGGRGQGS